MKYEIEKREKGTFIHFSNEEGFEVTFCDDGASIYEIKLDGISLTSSPMDKDYFVENGYWGKTIGRLSGRTKNAEVDFEGKKYNLPINEGNNSLHGGKEGFSFKRFDYRIKEDSIVFALVSPAFDQGLPGNVKLEVEYTIKNTILNIELRWKSDEDTLLNPTIHTYFNLGEKDIKNHLLCLKSSKVSCYDNELIPTGFVDVPDYMNFSKLKEIGESMDKDELKKSKARGIDHCYLPEEKAISLQSKRFRLTLTSDRPCIQVYSNNYPVDNLLMSGNKLDSRGLSVALEPFIYPNDFYLMKSKKEVWSKMYIKYEFERIG